MLQGRRCFLLQCGLAPCMMIHEMTQRSSLRALSATTKPQRHVYIVTSMFTGGPVLVVAANLRAPLVEIRVGVGLNGCTVISYPHTLYICYSRPRSSCCLFTKGGR
ncbi:unnamed protein product, partial [Ectocarpus fasciculatus]